IRLGAGPDRRQVTQASTGRAERSRRGLAAARQTATGPAWPAESAAADRSTVTALPDGSPMGSAAACQMMFHTPGSSRRRQTLGREAATAAGPEGRAARPPGTRTRPDAALETDTVTPISATRALWVSRLVIADPASLRVPTPGTQARADEAGRPATRDPTTPATPTPATPTPATATPSTPIPGTPIPGTQARADEAGRPTTRDPTTPATPTPDTPTPATPTPPTPTPPTPTPRTPTPATPTRATPTPDTATRATATRATPTPATATRGTPIPATPTRATATPATPPRATATPGTPTPATPTRATATPATQIPATSTPDTPTAGPSRWPMSPGQSEREPVTRASSGPRARWQPALSPRGLPACSARSSLSTR